MIKNNDIGNLTRYIMPELMPQVWCTACLGVVLKHNPKAKELFDEIVNCFDLPGFKEINKVSNKIVPDKKEILKEAVTKAGFDPSTPPEPDTFGIPYSKDLFSGGKDVISGYAEKIGSILFQDQRNVSEFYLLIEKTIELIREGFNREEDKQEGKFRLPSEKSETLMTSIITAAVIAFAVISTLSLNVPPGILITIVIIIIIPIIRAFFTHRGKGLKSIVKELTWHFSTLFVFGLLWSIGYLLYRLFGWEWAPFALIIGVPTVFMIWGVIYIVYLRISEKTEHKRVYKIILSQPGISHSSLKKKLSWNIFRNQ